MSETTHNIWPRETGIRDVEDVERVAVASVADLQNLWAQQRAELADSERLRTFNDQLAREWSIETGQIENLYDIERGTTKTLIERGFSAAILQHGVDGDEATILALLEDQRDALEGLFAFVKGDRALSVGYICELHAAMTRSQTSTHGVDQHGNPVEIPLLHGKWKEHENSPERGGVVYRYCPPDQVDAEMRRLVEMHAGHLQEGVPPEVTAAWLHHRFTQIHPFQDGNGRVARALASLVLIRAGLFPLVVPRGEKSVYLDTLERADQGDLRPLALLTARRQGVAYEMAIRLFNQFAPDEDSLESAAAALGRVYGRRDDVIAQRLRERVEQTYVKFTGALTQAAGRATQIMIQSSGYVPNRGGGGFGGSPPPAIGIDVVGGNAPEMYLPAIRLALLARWGLIAGAPCQWARATIRIGPTYELIVHIHAANPEVDDSVVVTAFLSLNGDWVALDVTPLTWKSEDNLNLDARASEWTDAALTAALNRVRRQR